MSTPSPESRLEQLGLELPPAFAPAGSYVPVQFSGDLAFVSGQGPMNGPPDVPTRGKVGRDLTVDQAREAARLTGLNVLAVLRSELGSLDRVRRVVKVLGFVNCAAGFNETPAVIDGCSDLLRDVFGDGGLHARSAVGVAELPFDIAVEIEAVVEVAAS
jgi:enamine deaminase RidA (YjgF/YER057c/UK114 family)